MPPASPISLCGTLTTRSGAWCRERQIAYTRYCDDMTFSGDFARDEVLRCVEPRLRALGVLSQSRKDKMAPGRPPAACDRYCGQQKVQCPVRRAPCTAPGAAFLPKIWHLRPHGASRDRRTGGPLPGSAPGPGQLPAADHAGKAGAAGSPGLADQSTAAIRRRAGDISGRKTDIVTWKKREHHVDVPAFSAFSEELGRISPAHKPPSAR